MASHSVVAECGDAKSVRMPSTQPQVSKVELNPLTVGQYWPVNSALGLHEDYAGSCS